MNSVGFSECFVRCGCIYSWASDSCCTSLKRRGEQIELLATRSGFFSAPSDAKCFRIKRETKICGRCCHSFITSFGVFTCIVMSLQKKRKEMHCFNMNNL